MSWTLHGDGKTITEGRVRQTGRTLWGPRTLGFGGQHIVAMFGATFLVPLLTGFPPTTTLFFSGVGTILFLVLTGNRLPSYLGSSLRVHRPDPGRRCSPTTWAPRCSAWWWTGLMLAVDGLHRHGDRDGWIEVDDAAGRHRRDRGADRPEPGPASPPSNYEASPWVATVTLARSSSCAVAFRGLVARLSILIGVGVGYVAAGIGGLLDFSTVGDASVVRAAGVHDPNATWSVIPCSCRSVLVLVAENVGHVRSVAHLTGRPLAQREDRSRAAGRRTRDRRSPAWAVAPRPRRTARTSAS